MKILIADDNRLMLEGFRRALEKVRDIEIAGVTDSGAEVLGLVERRRPDVVALELGLRTRDGRSCLEALCEEHNFPVLRKPFLASDVMYQIRGRLAPAGAVRRA